MGNHEDLRSKWRGLLEQGTTGRNFDLELLAPGRFCVHISDAGGESMACYSSVELTGFFDNDMDALAFLRFAEIPRILDCDTDTNRDPCPDVADAYLLKIEADERERIDHLIGLIDRSLKAEVISASELSLIRERFNEAFNSTNPQVQILAWGSLAEVLASDHFQEAFEEEMEEETDEDEKPVTKLKTLLDADEFDENYESHLALARLFLTTQLSV